MADPLRYDVEISPDVVRRMTDQTSGILRAMAAGIVGEMQRLMSLPKSGRAYRTSRTGELHIASAPGEAPAVDTGTLTNSINWSMNGETQAIVSINADYAAYLEYGTRFMARRPYIEPAIDKVRSDFAGILGQTRVRVNR
jgi:phage gpG-like protein